MQQILKSKELLKTLEIFHKAGEVVEVRILNTSKGTVSGYFDNHEELIRCIEDYIGKYNIFITLNPVKKDLLSRCNNRLKEYAKQTTCDTDIESIRYILVDIDPVRPSGISASRDEKDASYKILKQIRKDLIELGFSEPIVSDSGNGFHLQVPVELDNNEENVTLAKNFLAALDFIYSTDEVQVDCTTYNPARIVKFYGTLSCKGDNMVDRPHRWSKIIKYPENQNLATSDQLRLVIKRMPNMEEQKRESLKENKKTFNLESWIEENGLEVAFNAPFQNKGTKYILKTCPWNSDHTNRSAYIIQFDNGGIAAGCHHNSCREENWKSLKELVGITSELTSTTSDEKQSDVIIRLSKGCRFFRSDIDEPFAAAKFNGHWEVMDIKSKRFDMYLTKLYFEETGSAPGADSMNQAIRVMEMKATFSNDQLKLQKRVAKNGDDFYYDLCNPDWKVVKINADGCTIDESPPILFFRIKNMEQQCSPILTTKPENLLVLVKKHFRFKREVDTILFTTYLVSCFLPHIAHAILVIYGEKGSAKSTTMRMVKKIVDPAQCDLLSMPTVKQDLAIILSNTYMPCFDNLDSLSAEKSDILCIATTGGAFSKRTLYTNSDETILRFKRCVALNGINVVATRADLLDRSIVLELERIPKTERKTENAIWSSFDEDIPEFLGAIFNTISQTIPRYQSVALQEVGRMADFTCWGYAIADVLGIGGDEFIKAYLSNQDLANEEALNSHPVGAAVQALMRNSTKWVGSVSELLKKLEIVAEKERINTRVKIWAKDASVLSKRLKEVKSNLEEVGIYYDIRHAGGFKKITIEKPGKECLIGEETKLSPKKRVLSGQTPEAQKSMYDLFNEETEDDFKE